MLKQTVVGHFLKWGFLVSEYVDRLYLLLLIIHK